MNAAPQANRYRKPERDPCGCCAEGGLVRSPTPRQRTEEQEFANSFDCDLYRLIHWAEGRGTRQWQHIAVELRAARTAIRRLMHEADRKDTI